MANETAVAVMSDRQDWKMLDPVPTLDEVVKHKPGLVVVKTSELVTGFERQLYTAGFVVVETDSDGAVVRAYSQLPILPPEEA